MFTRKWPRHLLCLSLSLPLGSALACGPDFPMRLLDNRGQTLAELPEGNFNFEISRLGRLIPGLKNIAPATADQDYSYSEADDQTSPRDLAELVGLDDPVGVFNLKTPVFAAQTGFVRNQRARTVGVDPQAVAGLPARRDRGGDWKQWRGQDHASALPGWAGRAGRRQRICRR